MVKIYIAPSNQVRNTYAYGGTNESAQCNAIADRIAEILKGYDCECRVGKTSQTIQAKAAEANAWGANVYLSIHSNAGGGKGTEVWYNPNRNGSKNFADVVYKHISAISPGKDRGMKASTDFLDVNQPKIPCCLCEMEFHDWQDGAKWIVNSHEQIAQTFVNALVEYLEINRKTESYVLYRVQVGAFAVKANAENYAKRLKEDGYDAFVVSVGNSAEAKPVLKSVDEIAREVIAGNWGNGQDRVNRLTAAGYDAAEVQKAVNRII